MNRLVQVIVSSEEPVRNQALESLCASSSLAELQTDCAALDDFRRHADNLYQRVRALFFLSAIYRYYVPRRLAATAIGRIPYTAYQHLLQRRFSEAIDALLSAEVAQGASETLTSALAQAYRRLGFQTLADQVRRSVRTVRGNQWMFRLGHVEDQPLRIARSLQQRSSPHDPFNILCERTAVRMDFSHSAWSDIFFLGMDFPEGARVLNCSIDLAVRGRDTSPRPPIESYLRVIDRPVLRLVSIDLNAAVELSRIEEIFDFGRDYLGLLKAAVVAAGIVPPGLEGSPQSFSDLFSQMIAPGHGLELVSKVNDIPKGSRLAVSTNLLGSLIAICMRATGQVGALTGPLTERDRRIVAARSILGEWLGGSGGGWQDSGGLWPGIKLICGTAAEPGEPEFGVSRGRLLPNHQILDNSEVSLAAREKLQDSLVLVHGGMAQNVGPVLEMVTEKYLLRNSAEWNGRLQAMAILDEVVAALKKGDVRSVGQATTRNFQGPIQTIIPFATNFYTDLLIEEARRRFGEHFWGFWMLGGMAGGGMGFVFDPRHKAEGQGWLQDTMTEAMHRLRYTLPFAMAPVVYDFAINERGTLAELFEGADSKMPDAYYALLAPEWVRTDRRQLSPQTRAEMERLGTATRSRTLSADVAQVLLERMLPQPDHGEQQTEGLHELLDRFGFDYQQHEQIQTDLRSGRIGLAQNRLPSNASFEDVRPGDVRDFREGVGDRYVDRGVAALRAGSVAVFTLAAGVGSRWTEGAGVVKALHPFCKLEGRHRSFLEVHLAKSRRVSRQYGAPLTHIFSTGYLTDRPIREHLAENSNYGYDGRVILSPGRAVGLRMIPTVRDLRFLWEEMPQQMLDEQQQKVRASMRAALIEWAQRMGEASDYTDNIPLQCLHPVGHWYEVPNLLRNDVLAAVLADQPQVRTLLLSNVDTLGADVDPGMLGAHLESGCCLSFEVVPKRFDDHGGGLARVNGQARLVEGLAFPREEDDFRLSFYNSMTTWIDIDKLLAAWGLTRQQLMDQKAVDDAIRKSSRRLPAYITLKDVKKRWGHGQEDVYPVAQFERLWGDMSALPEISCEFFLTTVYRGQQLKHQAQLDGWLRDGSAEYVRQLCAW
jgi:hypothetical protein